jgi:sugar transferase EpsL
MKRALDVSLAILIGFVLLPIFFFVMLLCFLNFGTPVLFCQNRPGLNGKSFRMFKFRSMTRETDRYGKLLPDSERLTPFGRWLRASSFDELPELWNVVRGDMSLVGPRPLLLEYLPLYSPEQARRHDVRPGITGWAQVNGRNALTWEDKFALDVWYVENQSIWLDIKILALTIKRVLARDGISAAGEATMSRFTGSAKGGVQ